jgi:hypothetical protein
MIKEAQFFLIHKIDIVSSKKLCFYTRSTTYKKQGAPDWWSLTQQKIKLFTHVAPRIKSKGLPIDGPLLSKKMFFPASHRVAKARSSRSAVPYSVKKYAFYTRSKAYKKQGPLDQRSLTRQKVMLFTRVAPRIKSKRLPIDGPLLSKKICFLHA